jgi:V8-like Glu-specific endopeptidase
MKKTRNKVTSYEDMISSYYGKAPQERKYKFHHRFHHHKHKDLVVSKSFDNGEVLVQNMNPVEEYVVQSSVEEPQFEEYVVSKSMASATGWSPEDITDVSFEMVPPVESNPVSDLQVDLLDPLKEGNVSESKTDAEFASAKSTDDPVAVVYVDEEKKPKISEDELLADMKSILNGEKVYDPLTKQTVSREQLGNQNSRPPQPASKKQADEPPQPEFKNEHAIFDRIAQSMQYANAYDMGTMELDNRFSDFDRLFDYEEEGKNKKKKASGKEDQDLKTGNEEFIQDLDAIRQQASGIQHAVVGNAKKMADDFRDASKSESEEVIPANLADEGNSDQTNLSFGKIVNLPDDRTVVTDTSAIPYRWICKIEPTFKHPDTGNEIPFAPGTGLLIGPRHILTAAHVVENFIDTTVTNKHQWQKAVKVKITPGANGTGSEPFGSYFTTTYFILPAWSSGQNVNNRHDDFAVLVLNEDIGFKKFASLQNRPFGHFGDAAAGGNTHMTTLVPDIIKGVPVETAGYPHDNANTQSGKQWKTMGTIQAFPNDDPVFLHTMDTGLGQSGSPIWKNDNNTGEKILVGIHNGSVPTDSGQKNFGVMMTSNIVNQVIKWLA